MKVVIFGFFLAIFAQANDFEIIAGVPMQLHREARPCATSAVTYAKKSVKLDSSRSGLSAISWDGDPYQVVEIWYWFPMSGGQCFVVQAKPRDCKLYNASTHQGGMIDACPEFAKK